MLSQSAYWKIYLLKQALLLKKCATQKRWLEPSFAKFEIATMMGFYAIRKLVEANKLTTKLTETSIPMRLYPSHGKAVTRLNKHRIDGLYDLNAPKQTELNLTKLCHQFIHSYVFVPVFDERKRLAQILIASDYQRSKALLTIEVKTIIRTFKKVSSDGVRSTHAVFDDSLDDYRVKNYSASFTKQKLHVTMPSKSSRRNRI